MKFRIQKKGETFAEWTYYVKNKAKMDYNAGNLSPQEIEACKAKGIDFRDHQEILDENWMKAFERGVVCDFEFEMDSKDYWWAIAQRRTRKTAKLNQWKIDLLDKEGFRFETRRSSPFDERVKELKNFQSKHKRDPDLNGDEDESSLSKWRHSCNKRLRALGIYSIEEVITFETQLNELLEFRKKHNRNPKCRNSPPEESRLYNWKIRYRKKLKELGIYEGIPRTQVIFEKRIADLKKFRDTNKRNPSSFSKDKTEKSLAGWRGGKHRELKKMGIYDYGDKTRKELHFEKRLEQLKQFYKTNKRIPSSISKNDIERSLGCWRKGGNHRKLKELGMFNYKKED